MRTIRLLLQYEGTEYAGWQTQNNAVTIQDLVEQALTTILQEKIRVTGASRTDSGVHALGQVAAFKTSKSILSERLLRSLNGILPPDIRVIEAGEAAVPEYGRAQSCHQAAVPWPMLREAETMASSVRAVPDNSETTRPSYMIDTRSQRPMSSA